MGLTFKKQDELEKLFDKFATVPKDKKKKFTKDKDEKTSKRINKNGSPKRTIFSYKFTDFVQSIATLL